MTTPAPGVVLGVAVAGAAGARGAVVGVGDAGWIAGAAGVESMPSGERLIGIGLGVVLLAEFLKDEE